MERWPHERCAHQRRAAVMEATVPGAPRRRVVWSDAARAHLAMLLSASNGQRAARVATWEQVEQLVEQALEAPEGFAWSAAALDDARALTTVCLAVVTPTALVVGVARARAKGVTPASAWSDIPSWNRWDAASNQARVQVWARRVQADRMQLSFAAPSGVTTAMEAVHEAIFARPDDDAPRLVYADWLTERGDPRGELIALQCARARAEATTREVRAGALGLQPRDSDDLAEATATREAELLALHGETWLAGVPRSAVQVRFARGFIHELTVLDARTMAPLDALFAREPIERLRFASGCGVDLGKLRAAPWLSRVRHLAFSSDPGSFPFFDGRSLTAFLPGRELRALTELELSGQRVGDLGAAMLAGGAVATAPALKRLTIASDVLTPFAGQALASTRFLGKLAALALPDNQLRAEGVDALLRARSPGRLEILVLDGNHLGDDGARIIASEAKLRTLKHLSLARNRIGPAGAQALLTSPTLRGLETLELAGNPIGAKAKARLASALTP
ncbi:MAG: TIGR02996 domain-containing protein [Archangium sp.]|nr:TIGR02996 domain-containing protein [Archangium sp.]